MTNASNIAQAPLRPISQKDSTHGSLLTFADDTPIKNAQRPIIVSASRSTDIPAFYAEWFFKRLEAGYSVWTNPFNGKSMYISYEDTRFIVFWSKNPTPLLPYLDTLKQKGIGCYVQYTLNDYVSEGYEPQVPPVETRIATFRQLSEKLGRHAVIWRSDPLMLTDKIGPDALLKRIERIGDALHNYTERLVFSFVDITCYGKVRTNLQNKLINYIEWTPETMHSFAAELKALNEKRGWGYALATCGEEIDLECFGIAHSRCIDDRLIVRIAHEDDVLIRHLGYEIVNSENVPIQQSLFQRECASDGKPTPGAVDLGDGRYAVKRNTKISKDNGQRKACGCIKSKDIGQYNTCKHFCVYCYANWSQASVLANYAAHIQNSDAETITGKEIASRS